MKKILFGAGKVGRILSQKLDDVAYFCDTYKSGDIIDGVQVISVGKLRELVKEQEYEVIVSVSDEESRKEIGSILDESGVRYRYITEIDEIKYTEELDFWKRRFHEEDRSFENTFYSRLMLSIARENDDVFLRDKVVADFGCGPRGSLSWMKSPKIKIGIDVLATEYTKNFGDDLVNHGMMYVTSTEDHIPMPDACVDCIMTINSLDHVRKLDRMCGEMMRILKKGGIFLGSFNLYEKATECEPQTLTEEGLKQALFDPYISIEKYRIARMGEKDTYKYMEKEEYIDNADGTYPCVLWVRGVKK